MEIGYEWAQKYEIGKRVDAALLDGNGDHRACISVPDTRRGTFMLYEIISGFYVDYCHRGAHDGLCLQVNFGKEKFFIPQMDLKSTEATLTAIDTLDAKIFQRRRREGLIKHMEKIYLQAEHDSGCVTAINIYKNMSQKRLESEAGQEIREYLTAMSESILLWDLETQLPKQLGDFLQLDCTPPEILRKVFSAKYDDMSIDEKSYMLDAMRRAEKWEASQNTTHPRACGL